MISDSQKPLKIHHALYSDGSRHLILPRVHPALLKSLPPPHRQHTDTPPDDPIPNVLKVLQVPMVLLQRLHYIPLRPKISFPIFIQTHAQQRAIWLIPLVNEEVNDDVVEYNLKVLLRKARGL
jgi:hypothetical protein